MKVVKPHQVQERMAAGFESIVNCKACVVMQVKVLTWYVFERSVNDKVF